MLKANAVVSIVNPLTKADKLAYLLNDCRARALITDAHLAPRLRRRRARESPHLATVIVSGDRDRGATLERPAACAVGDDALAGDARRAAAAAPRIDVDLAAIIYTSGSTGDPKGVMLTHRNMLTAATSITSYLEIARGRRDPRRPAARVRLRPLPDDHGVPARARGSCSSGRSPSRPQVLERSWPRSASPASPACRRSSRSSPR